jgi:XRE family transcriptional regulator, aerobic/anaerobic benzoate catabolism transcriptional regulator
MQDPARRAAPPIPKRSADAPTRKYLARLGERIRTARAQRGMTRLGLASASGVSERFLAQLEVGRGNPSIVILRSIANAMSFPVEELLSEAAPRPINQVLIGQMLGRLSETQLIEVRRLLAERFLRTPKEQRNYVALIGLRGGGKSTLGRMLAEQRGVPFVELDREVERECGATIGEILELYGQRGYRRFERQCLEKAFAEHEAAVIEIGGGLATDPDTLSLLLDTTRTVWIKASPKEHIKRVVDQGDLRPLADDPRAMHDRNASLILKAREPYYRQASLHLDTSGKTVAQSFKALLKLLEE